MKILTVVGARPQFVKSFSASRALSAMDVNEILVHTGQHLDPSMSRVFFEEMGLKEPDYHLGICGGGHGAMTGRMLEKIEEVLVREKPAAVLVYGDTNSTLAAALAAVKLTIPVVHVEAGLRSRRIDMPEEVNRIVADHVASLLCCPTKSAVAQLRREGFSRILQHGELMDMRMLNDSGLDRNAQVVVNVGDVMLDVLRHFREKAAGLSSILSRLEISPESYALLTMHRADVTDNPALLRLCLSEVAQVANELFPVVFPVHPRTRMAIESAGMYESYVNCPGMIITEPLSYFDFVHLQANASVIITDSGGVQKEAFFLERPCITLRDETEWTETVESGMNRLVGKNPVGLATVVREMLEAFSSSCERDMTIFGRGNAGALVARLVKHLYA